MSDDLEALAAEAQRGSRGSLERLGIEIQRPVYTMARRILWHPEDAQDASQVLARIRAAIDL